MESATAPEVPAQSSPTDALPVTGALEGAFPQGLASL